MRGVWMMDRVKHGYSAVIEAAYAVIPTAMHDLIRPHFLTGTDPVFAGLHSYSEATYGRSYRDTAHVAFDHNQTGLVRSQRYVTVVLPQVEPLPVLVHELGHVLHATLRFEPEAGPVTWYAKDNRYEAFAEAFTSWLIPGYHCARPAASASGSRDATNERTSWPISRGWNTTSVSPTRNRPALSWWMATASPFRRCQIWAW